MNTTNKNLENAQTKLNNKQFASIVVSRVRTGLTSYCGRILSVTDKTIRFEDVNKGRVRTIPVANVVYVS